MWKREVDGLVLTFRLAGINNQNFLMRDEQPNGTLLKDSAAYAPKYAKKDWDVRMPKTPTVLSYAQPGLMPRTLVIGVRAFGAARAYPHEIVLAEKLVLDRLGGVPVLIVVGPDGQSVRGFRSQLPGSDLELEFYRTDANAAALMMDNATGSRWNFQGCAVEGKSTGICLERLDIIKDYWFDWRHYNPATSVSKRRPSHCHD